MNEIVKMIDLCWTGTTLYALDTKGYVWYIDMRTGTWALHGNPSNADLKKLLGDDHE